MGAARDVQIIRHRKDAVFHQAPNSPAAHVLVLRLFDGSPGQVEVAESLDRDCGGFDEVDEGLFDSCFCFFAIEQAALRGEAAWSG